MDDHELQQAWQSQACDGIAPANVDAVLEKVLDRHRRSVRSVFWRDVREVGVSALVAAYFVLLSKHEIIGGWPWLLAAALMLGIGAFMAADRARERRRARRFGESAKDGVQRALMQVSHQVWLLERVFWWYLLPGAAAYALGVAHCLSIAQVLTHGLPYRVSMKALLGLAAFGTTIFCVIYRLNRTAVRDDLLPRQRELEELARALTEEEH